MAKITRTRLIVSSVALLLMATTMMIPVTTDARGTGGFGGHGGGFHFGRTTHPNPGPITVRRSFASSPRHVASSMSFAHRNESVRHSRRIGSHFFTLGADGIWVDNFVYAPTTPVTQQPMPLQQSVMHRAPAVKTPSAARAGIILVRGDSKSYVTFPFPRRG
jgi:hypothetical protein